MQFKGSFKGEIFEDDFCEEEFGLQTIPRHDSGCKMNYFTRGDFFKPSKCSGKAWGPQNRGGFQGGPGEWGGPGWGHAGIICLVFATMSLPMSGLPWKNPPGRAMAPPWYP